MITHDHAPRWDIDVSPPDSPDDTDRTLHISLTTLERMDEAIRNILNQDPTIIPTQTTGEQYE